MRRQILAKRTMTLNWSWTPAAFMCNTHPLAPVDRVRRWLGWIEPKPPHHQNDRREHTTPDVEGKLEHTQRGVWVVVELADRVSAQPYRRRSSIRIKSISQIKVVHCGIATTKRPRYSRHL